MLLYHLDFLLDGTRVQTLVAVHKQLVYLKFTKLVIYEDYCDEIDFKHINLFSMYKVSNAWENLPDEKILSLLLCVRIGAQE